MTASEKLRALHREQLQEGRWPSLPDGREEIILNAIPAIIAVVEAAEQCDREFGEHLPPAGTPWRPVRAALATLSQALESGDVT